MRTAKEIRQYLKCQPWYKDFMYYTKTSRLYCWHYDKRQLKRVLKGYRYIDTILAAFVWDYTMEGFDVWDKRDMAFRIWYFRKYEKNSNKNSKGN